MTVKVLIVDDVPANVKLLEARLKVEHFKVLTASNGLEALEICARGMPDVVLMDVRMPGMDGLSACRHLKANSATRHIPVVIVTALDQIADKCAGIEAGADDFLVKPVDDIALVTRVRNLARLKTLSAEINEHLKTYNHPGVLEETGPAGSLLDNEGRILIIESHPRHAQRLARMLAQSHTCAIETNPRNALLRLGNETFDLAIVNLNLAAADGLELCSHIRAVQDDRQLRLIILVEPIDEARLRRGFEIGINDYLVYPIEQNDLWVRVRTQIKSKRYEDFLGTQNVQGVACLIES